MVLLGLLGSGPSPSLSLGPPSPLGSPWALPLPRALSLPGPWALGPPPPWAQPGTWALSLPEPWAPGPWDQGLQKPIRQLKKPIQLPYPQDASAGWSLFLAGWGFFLAGRTTFNPHFNFTSNLPNCVLLATCSTSGRKFITLICHQ